MEPVSMEQQSIRVLRRLAESHDATFGPLFQALSPTARETLMEGMEKALGDALNQGRMIVGMVSGNKTP
jgi:hypothetical protein